MTGHPAGIDGTASTQMVAGWRDGVWRNAEHLEGATSAAHRGAVAAWIEHQAWAWAEPMAAPEIPGYRQQRAEHCEAALARDTRRGR